MSTLSYLIAKCDWDGVYQRLLEKPEEAAIPIPTGSKETVYALHQAICSRVKPVPRKILLTLIKQSPNALDLNAFIGACENPQLSVDSVKLLLDTSVPKVYQSVQKNAQHYACIAVEQKNVCTVQLFIERFPSILNSNILAFACTHGTAEIVEKILSAGFRRNIGKAAGLFLKMNNKEDALDIAIRQYDESDDERRHTLVTCVQYANAVKMGMPALDPGYPVTIAAIGLVPRRILGSLLKLYAHEVENTNQSGKHAIVKAIQMSMKENQYHTLPSIFKSENFINACGSGKIELVHQLLKKRVQHSTEELSSEHSENFSYKERNALDVAIDLFDKKDNSRCEILRTCIQYANAANLGKKSPSSNYPTILAAVGLVPTQTLLIIGKQYRHEIRKMDCTGKFALKKVLRMAEEETTYATRLDVRCQYPLSISIKRVKLSSSLETIPQ
eukprot:CAMPEP_0198263156 /NCGR_PEP_ID=MMETSP1447-20131203/11561_1 /TAXON_ID=420782 /ORGANISM="Chaetoceros dichaeta, Strain CCMP1751" /LENGTH=443 /DNA_ID=CAMNT_0043951655 /DNA_START=9 /DNA_END=1340 /DNA_ORIENTATION=+